MDYINAFWWAPDRACADINGKNEDDPDHHGLGVTVRHQCTCWYEPFRIMRAVPVTVIGFGNY